MFLIPLGLFFISLMVKNSVSVKIVQIDSPHCTLQRNILKCDFEFHKEDVLFDAQTPELLKTQLSSIHIANVNKLIAPTLICTDVQFRNIEQIDLNNKVCTQRKVALYFIDSKVDIVPRQLGRLELVNSEITYLNCDMGLQKILISHSKVAEFNVPWPQGGSYYMKIEHSVIEKFISLKLDFQVLLYITNTTIKSLERESLVLGKDATVSIKDSDIHSRERGIVVRTGSRVLIENTKGKIILTGPTSDKEYAYDKSPPGVPQKILTPSSVDDKDAIKQDTKVPENSCKSQPYWHWMIPTVVASLEGLVIISMCGKKIPYKRKPSMQPDTESPGDLLNSMQDSTVSYYSENPKINLTRRR